MRLLLIDNYDSFTHNLRHLILGATDCVLVEVMVNDRIDMGRIDEFDSVVISPGAGIPSEAGGLMAALDQLIGQKPVLGICLGHQAIWEQMGGQLTQLPHPQHGVQSTISIDCQCPLFAGLEPSIEVGRYHSWVVDRTTLPDRLTITATDSCGDVMAVSHKDYPLFGLQFHPESFLTPMGQKIMRNFLQL